MQKSLGQMSSTCTATGCKTTVPSALESERMCVLHFTLGIEQACAEMRRETVLGRTAHERHVEIMRYIAQHGEVLARTATSGLVLADEMKARILNTFLTLMNLRENLDRAALRQPIGRSGGAPAERGGAERGFHRESRINFRRSERRGCGPRRDRACL